jgi:membrane protease YdiL (CAAX protease family)
VRRSRRPIVAELTALGVVAVYNIVAHRHIGRRARLVANVGAATVLVAAARAAGLTASELGMGRAELRRGTRVGLLAAVPIVAGVGTALAVPKARALLADEKITGTGRREAAFETLVRIPLETALSEEVIFRGVLLGLALRNRSRIGAIASSSLWFGLWHVYPTVGSLDRGTGGALGAGGAGARAGATAGVVAATTAAGMAFAGLRLGSGSVAAPVVAHAALNMAAFAGVRLTHGSGSGSAPLSGRAAGAVPQLG